MVFLLLLLPCDASLLFLLLPLLLLNNAGTSARYGIFTAFADAGANAAVNMVAVGGVVVAVVVVVVVVVFIAVVAAICVDFSANVATAAANSPTKGYPRYCYNLSQP